MRTSIERLVLVAFALAACANAEVQLPKVLTDHMVVQRGVPVHVWGWAEKKEVVAVTFRGETRSSTANDAGTWSVYFPAAQAGGPYEITVKASNTITLTDVLVGDVWIGSGQSNMEWTVKNTDNAQAEIAAANYPQIRLFYVDHTTSGYPLDDVSAKPWAVCTPESVPEFSAVAYYFGRDLHKKLKVPIGIINSSWGGTPVDSWTSQRAITADAALMPVYGAWAKDMGRIAERKRRWEVELKEWEAVAAKAKAEGKPAPNKPWFNDMVSWEPAGLYNSMIAPLTPFPIRGAIWYQGESNAGEDRAPLYGRIFRAMIEDWRRAWGVGDFPFLFVQLANFKNTAKWPELREQQLKTLGLTNTAMAVTIDIGNPVDIHPRNKQDVGKRLALGALALSYGERIEYSGPLYRTAAPDGSAMRVFFDHTGTGLAAKGDKLKGFEVAGGDGHYQPAEARVEGATVVVSSPSVASPVKVRYGWSDVPDCNLYNAEGLPASPFRSAE